MGQISGIYTNKTVLITQNSRSFKNGKVNVMQNTGFYGCGFLTITGHTPEITVF